MARRSSGLFPREGFNFDDALAVTAVDLAAAVTLTNAKTIRVAVAGSYTARTGTTSTDATLVIDIGGQSHTVPIDGLDGGAYIFHLRGALCSDNNVQYVLTPGVDGDGTAGAFTIGGVFYELVDGPRR